MVAREQSPLKQVTTERKSVSINRDFMEAKPTGSESGRQVQI
ncbi:hypothetical protein LEP1GSC047_3537 [Leptospira inadai serovar Lyme str. 10]|uniref:Uncharacterized protein n=1 Tax=Leptospira inadai serovar Lyme str. 10 TaxID=1049790 RepID=V6HDN0_9LEPT|nr:hypothetical protein LEP1GSC047_3537 [Leptospira inadai serovar Lyme str. 10]